MYHISVLIQQLKIFHFAVIIFFYLKYVNQRRINHGQYYRVETFHSVTFYFDSLEGIWKDKYNQLLRLFTYALSCLEKDVK